LLSGSPGFSVKLNGFLPELGTSVPVQGNAIKAASKFEAITQTPDQQFIIATTAFDRFDPENSQWDQYNTLLVWPADSPENAKPINPSTRNGITSSLAIRKALESYLGAPYFKLEGLTLLPDNGLVLGIREIGNNHQDFAYRILMISARLEKSPAGEFSVDLATLTTILDYTPPDSLGLDSNLGISSIEAIPGTYQLYFTTSHEEGEDFSAYLWEWNTLASDHPPKLLREKTGSPLRFNHKAEGIAVLDAHHLFIVHDDDRKTGGQPFRQPHQAPYSIIELDDFH
jgi:hypothetical protein